jgi:hypothetical protein
MRILLALIILLFSLVPAVAHDSSQHAQLDPGDRQWFDGLKDANGNGCCSTADGLRLKTDAIDPEWRCGEVAGKPKCQVKILGLWYDVPDIALLKVPNRVGYAIVWYVLDDEADQGGIRIRCFMRGIET